MSTRHNPLVSVIIPAYNAEKHIAGTIRSLLDQEWENIEIIIVDDGSSDRTLEIARTFEGEKVKVALQQNLGGCAARNLGFDLSHGDYVQFMDADDLVSRDKISFQVIALMDQPGKVAVCSTVHFFDGEDPYTAPVPDESEYLYSTDDTAAFFAGLWGANGTMWMVQTSAWLVERSLVEKYGRWNTNILLDQDGEFFSRIVLESAGICFTNGINYYRKYLKGKNVAGKYSSYKHLSSAIDAAGLKSGYLLKKRTDRMTRKASANLFMQLAINSYPEYPDLYNKSMDMVREMKVSPVIPILGGRVIETVKFIFGWKIAKKISYEFHKSRA